MSLPQIVYGIALNPDELQVIALGYKLACTELNLADGDDPVQTDLAKKIIALAQAGERDPSRLAQRAIGSLSSIERIEERQTG
jgi:hypothetical protein